MYCELCGATPTTAADKLTWTSSVERGRTKHFCTPCSRDNIRSIEGKLDSEWW